MLKQHHAAKTHSPITATTKLTPRSSMLAKSCRKPARYVEQAMENVQPMQSTLITRPIISFELHI